MVYKKHVVVLGLKVVWLVFCLTGIISGQCGDVRTAVEAVAAVAAHPEIQERLDEVNGLRISAEFNRQWNVWMVEFFSMDERRAFATVNQEGEILEIGPDIREFIGSDERRKRLNKLRAELDFSLRTGNEPEIREILELIERLGGELETVDVDRLLDSFEAIAGYSMTILRWKSQNVGHIHLERREGNTDWVKLSDVAIHEGRWIDHEAAPRTYYSYRLRYLPPDGELSAYSPIRPVIPKDISESSLPLYALKLPVAGIRSMLDDVTEEIVLEGRLQFTGKSYPINIRLRGASTRQALKKSYRIQFKDETPIGRKVTYLKAEPMDHTLQQEKLSCDVFRTAGAEVSRVRYVNLTINGRYEGVYLDIEPIRAPFKRSPGLDPEGALIRAQTFQHLEGWDGLGEIRGKTGSLAELREFIKRINRTDRGDFERFVREQTDWPRVRDYLVLQVICHRSEIEADDYFFYREPGSGQWWFLSWDHNNGNFNVQAFENRVGRPFMHLYNQTIQDIGWRPSHWFTLPSRIYQNDALRTDFLNRLEWMLREFVHSGKVDTMIDRNYSSIEADYILDPYRIPFDGTDPFLDSDQDLKRFMSRHSKMLQRQIDAERAGTPHDLVINEFQISPEDGWVELYNCGTEGIHLWKYYLATKTDTGNCTLPLKDAGVVASGGFFVVRFGNGFDSFSQANENAFSSKWRREEDTTESPESPSIALDPKGGFLALVRAKDAGQRESDDENLREEVMEFFFYGPRKHSSSYGRWNDGFSRLQPSPGKSNIKAE